ncbi:hypothetical protein, partial [Methanobacterium sp.]|uniref:hypothetical protein n=2 Tax=Methanobacterium sp. TaxID=2164 RepID=UPI003C78D866
EELKKQLYTYLLALKLNQEFHNENIEEIVVYLLKAPKDNKLQIFDIDEEYLNKFQNKITSVAQNVNNNIFKKNIQEPVIIAHLALFANKKKIEHQLHVFIFFTNKPNCCKCLTTTCR